MSNILDKAATLRSKRLWNRSNNKWKDLKMIRKAFSKKFSQRIDLLIDSKSRLRSFKMTTHMKDKYKIWLLKSRKLSLRPREWKSVVTFTRLNVQLSKRKMSRCNVITRLYTSRWRTFNKQAMQNEPIMQSYRVPCPRMKSKSKCFNLSLQPKSYSHRSWRVKKNNLRRLWRVK